MLFQVLVLALLAGASAQPPPTPVIPSAFVADFLEYTAPLTNAPPYLDGVPQAPFVGSRGKAYYDWSLGNMIEERLDYCVNIFPTGNNFTCTFFNVKGTSYLISNDSTGVHPPCCLFGQPWHPPPPNFIQSDPTAALVSTEGWSGSPADWWILPSIEPPTGPFYFAFNHSKPGALYLSFSFPGIEGWVVQNFFNVKYQKPDPSVWILPSVCTIPNLPNCGFF